jgi:[ribosomal protein S5]-alanine N-acetyltransferase
LFAPDVLRTARLVLRRPVPDDLDGVHAYASDPGLTTYMAWPRHQSLDETRHFLDQAGKEWDQNGTGAFLVCDPDTGDILGSTGLHLATRYRGVTGYILQRAAWGKGYATEACTEMVALARRLGLSRIEADCHLAHGASGRVLEKAGLLHEGILRAFLVFPNLDDNVAHDVHIYGLALRP